MNDHLENTEDEVFDACTRAVDEISGLIQKISGSADTYRFIVTSDHGFIYKRNPVTQSDKISTAEEPGKLKKRRYIVAKEPVIDDGIVNIGLGYMLGNDDSKIISCSCSTNVFSAKGNAGLNCVHGGSSPQEIVADKRDEDVQKRLFRMRFIFKNKKYDKNKKYYLAAYDESNDVEVFRHEVIMNVAFANDFGF